MFAHKIFWGPRPGLWCVLASLGQSVVRVKNFKSQRPVEAEI